VIVVLSILGFALAVGIIVTLHEFGHFIVARLLGIKVERFSIGFGRPLWKRRMGRRDPWELAVSAIPLGGYVKMLDGREGPIPPGLEHRAFDRQSVARRAAVVAAGPLTNFLLAIVLLWIVFQAGVVGLKSYVGTVRPGSPAAEAGLASGDRILKVGSTSTLTWNQLDLALFNAVLVHRRVRLVVRTHGGAVRTLSLTVRHRRALTAPHALLRGLGFRPAYPRLLPVVGRVEPGSPAARAGLRPGERILSANGHDLRSWSALVRFVTARPGRRVRLVVVAPHGGRRSATVTLSRVRVSGRTVGRLGVYVRVPQDFGASSFKTIRYGPLSALGMAARYTWKLAGLTLRVLVGMVAGTASLRNLSGPIHIADYAGRSLKAGFFSFLSFIGIISISIGLLNILPIPLLDGGHLLYYAFEAVRGRPLSEGAQIVGQRVGLAVLTLLVALALYNDFMHFFF
jgi:regulator of sigma E protease